MANIKLIARAKVSQAAIKQILGIQPKMDIYDDYIELYYTPDTLPAAQTNFISLVERDEPSKIKIRFKPVIKPYAIKKVMPYAIGTLLTGFLLGKML